MVEWEAGSRILRRLYKSVLNKSDKAGINNYGNIAGEAANG